MAPAARIFVSYRRADTRHIAGRLADRLADHFGAEQVFMDVDAIEPGDDVGDVIVDAVSSCGVLVALIGPIWAAASDPGGHRRLDDPDDFVTLEIGTALDRGIRVVPVLVDNASMPVRDELPPVLHRLVRKHAARLDHESFRSDSDRLIAAIDRAVQRSGPASAVRPAESIAGSLPLERRGPGDPASDGAESDRRGPPFQLGEITPEAIRTVRFSKPPVGKRGYNEDEVDVFLDLLEAALGPTATSTLTSADVHNVAFAKPAIGKRGYNEDEVDAFLDLVEAELRKRGR